jgi:hypothetical protein
VLTVVVAIITVNDSGFSSQRPVLNLRAGFVGFVVDTVALGEDFL